MLANPEDGLPINSPRPNLSAVCEDGENGHLNGHRYVKILIISFVEQ